MNCIQRPAITLLGDEEDEGLLVSMHGLIGPNMPTPSGTSNVDAPAKLPQSMNGLKNGHRIINIVALVLVVLTIVQIWALGEIDFNSACFTLGMAVRSRIVVCLSVAMLAFTQYAVSRLLESSIYRIHTVLMIIWLIALLLFGIWFVVDIAWACTNQSSSASNPATTGLGFWLLAVPTWAELAVVIVQFFMFSNLKKRRRTLLESYRAADESLLGSLFATAMGGYTRYIKTIG